MASVSQYAAIAKANLRHNFPGHFFACLFLLAAVPALFGITDLDAIAAAVPLESVVSLSGIILLTPVFFPEHDENISGLVRSKYTDYLTVYMIRTICSAAALFIMICVFVFIMKLNGCVVDIRYALGTFATAFFFGSIGFFASGVTNSIAVSYMIPILYYIISMVMGNKSMGNFYPFYMMQGNFRGKILLTLCAAVIIGLTFLLKAAKRKIH